MVVRKSIYGAKNTNVGGQDRDYAISYDWHSKALEGHLILCRWEHKQQGGKFCIFLNDTAFEIFKPREGTDV